MKWVEMIRVRSSTDGIAILSDGLPRIITTLRKKEEIQDAILLIHALYLGDLAVILIWKGDGQPKKSSDGIFLATHFREYGTVEHAVWLIASNELESNSNHPES